MERIARSWRFFALIATPILLLPLIVFNEYDKKFRMAYAMLLMGIYWALELCPMPITALLPLLLFPLLGIQDIYEVSENYSKESNMIFLTGVVVAIALEYCNLHRRIALRVMTLVGGSSVRLLGATMIVTAILAMWLSSTTCAVLILPTVVAIIDEVNDSPAVMSSSEIRRKSTAVSSQAIASVLNGLPTSDSAKMSAFVANRLMGNQGDRRRSSVFENAALVGPSPKFRRKSSVFDNSALVGPRSRRGSVQVGKIDEEAPPAKPRDKRVSIAVISELKNNNTRRFSRGPRGSMPAQNFLPSLQMNETQEDDNENENEEPDKTEDEVMEEERSKQRIKTMFLLGIAYSANIGGTAVITGAGPNKIFKEDIKPLDVSQGGIYRDITFLTWLAANLPAMAVNVFIAWVFLGVRLPGSQLLKRRNSEPYIYKWKATAVHNYLRNEYEKLGRISYHEVMVVLIFLLVIILWIFRDPEYLKGWGDLYTGAKSGDSTGAMFGVILLFVIPKCWKFITRGDPEDIYEPLLDWKFTAGKIPWSVLLLLGSGFAIADAVEKSGLSEWLGGKLELLDDLPRPALLVIVITAISMITELVSNVACANIIIPILISISKRIHLHPLYLTVSGAVACSYAFMLPVASPTNALVFASGNFRGSQMARIGIVLNVICISVLFVSTITWGNYIFDFENYKYPETDEGDVDH